MKKVITLLVFNLILGLSIGDATENPLLASATISNKVIPALCYHRFGPISKKNNYALSVAEFEKQLAIIKEEGFTPITPKQALAALAGDQVWPVKPLLITVDDGYKDFITYAKPSLDKYGYKATLFVYTDFVGARLGFSKEELKMLTAEGHEIGSHSSTHSRLSKVKKEENQVQREARLDKELAGSREKLTTWSGSEVVALAYPYGLWDQTVVKRAEKAGYQLMFTVCSAPNAEQTKTYRWHRYMIVQGLRQSSFRKYLREQALLLTNRQPEPGAHVLGPVKEITANLSPEHLDLINIKTLVARSGQSVYPLKIDEQSGHIKINLTKPWKKGTDQITLTAKDNQGNNYRDSWLIVVDKQDEKGTK